MNEDAGLSGASAPALLVVDDNALNLRLLGDVLSTRYAVTLVRSGEAALRAARETPFDLILMDVQMPGMSGTEAMRTLKRDPDWRAPILAVTALAMQGDEGQLLEAGFDGYVSKPIAYKALLGTVATHLGCS